MRFRTVPKTAFRDNLKDELSSLGEEAMVITQRGRAVAIVITAERWTDSRTNWTSSAELSRGLSTNAPVGRRSWPGSRRATEEWVGLPPGAELSSAQRAAEQDPVGEVRAGRAGGKEVVGRSARITQGARGRHTAAVEPIAGPQLADRPAVS